ncbi:MAG TPA: hypothetical protein DCL44_02175 [Elusimicrobia bacterium]|nr:hypothetical protein [Elusimicrobiota bacterium]
MNEKFDENSLNEAAINDVETARLALRWSLDKIRALQEEGLKDRQNLQERGSQLSFLENQLKSKNTEIEKILRSHDDEIKSKQDSLEYQFHSKLERLNEREKELEDKLSKQEENLKQKENKLLDDYQKKSEELRARWSQIEGELWQLRQEQLAKQQEFEKLYSDRLDDERKKFGEEADINKASQEKTYRTRLEELERREAATAEELKKQEAVLKWSRDSWQKEVDEREKALQHKNGEIDKRLLEKNQEIEDYKVKLGLMEKQFKELPEAVRKRDQDIDRYKDALASLEGVIKTLEIEKKNQREDSEGRIFKLTAALHDMEAEIPKRLKIAVEHERNRFAEKINEIDLNYRQDLKKRQEEVDYLARNLKTFEEAMKTLQADRAVAIQKAEQLQTQLGMKTEENSFREKQMQSEYEVRLKVEIEKHIVALRSEIETSGHIYEDSLRMKVEEIGRLRRDLEEISRDKASLQGVIGSMRRELEALAEKREADLQSLRIQLKAAHNAELALVLESESRRYDEEKEKMLADFGAQISAIKFVSDTRERELQELKGAFALLQEEKKTALAAAAVAGKAELDALAQRHGEENKFTEEKIAQLKRNIDALKLEREELVLLEREKLTRLYTEKEKYYDEQLAEKDGEAARLKENLRRAADEKQAAITEAEKDKALLNEKTRALSNQFAEERAAAGSVLDEALKRQAEVFSAQLGCKNREFEALKRSHEVQEAEYRRMLEEFRSKLSESLPKTEALKQLSEERQSKLNSLQSDLAKEKSDAAAEMAVLSGKLSAKEKECRELKLQSETLKSNFEVFVSEDEKKINDIMIKLKNAETQKAAKDRQMDAFKREMEFWRASVEKKDEEIISFKSEFSRTLEEERKQIGVIREKLGKDYAEKEKSFAREIAALRDALNEKDVVAEQLRGAAQDLARNFERAKNNHDEERSRRTVLENEAQIVLSAFKEKEKNLKDARWEAERLAKALEASEKNVREKDSVLEKFVAEFDNVKQAGAEHEKGKKLVEQLKEKLRSWKNQ